MHLSVRSIDLDFKSGTFKLSGMMSLEWRDPPYPSQLSGLRRSFYTTAWRRSSCFARWPYSTILGTLFTPSQFTPSLLVPPIFPTFPG